MCWSRRSRAAHGWSRGPGADDKCACPCLVETFRAGRRRDVLPSDEASVRWAQLVVTPVGEAFWVFPTEILRVFGAEFAVGAPALRLITTGFWLRAALGSVS